MAITKLPDYPARLGDKQMVVANITGPASYASTGQPIGVVNNQTGIALLGMGSIDFVNTSMSVSGTYNIIAQPSGIGSRKVWNLFWIVTATGVPVAAATNLSTETAAIEVIGR